MFKAKKSMGFALFGLVAAAGATVLSVSTLSTTTSGLLSQRGSSGAGAGLARQAAARAERPGPYIVVYGEAALAAYDGSIAGLPAPPALATINPKAGTDRIDVKSREARAYVAHLQKRQRLHENTIAATLGRKLNVHRRMQHATNADIIDLTASEAARVGKLANVVLVEGYREYRLDSDTGPARIGAEPVWNGAIPGSAPGHNRVAAKGERVVVGVIDTGINFGSPSFAAVDPIDGYQHVNPLGAGNYLGTCQPGGPDAGRCNDKLIGGYDFVCNLPAPVGVGYTFCSATGYFREEPGFGDTNSHGSHVAATAAGNRRDAMYKGATRRISGVAPRANIVAYDVCYHDLQSGGGSCPNTATVAAVDQAVADGVVDVINFSISGGMSPWGDALSLAFLNAVDAGIYVSVSAGNSGPGPNTMSHLQPWTASTAAAQHGRGAFQPLFQVTGAGVPEALTAILMHEGSGGVAQTAALSGPLKVSPGIDTVGDGCAAYPANAFQGAIAVIRRGGCDFSVKANFARDAGAIATIIANNVAGTVTPSVPGTTIPVFSVMQADGDAIRDWTAGKPASTGLIGFPPAAIPNVADALGVFSSRGPAAALDLVKPDITAPGVDILAAVAGTTLTGFENAVGVMSGTSMASPHHAGAAALMRQLQPHWTVPEIKSALEMTAVQEVFLEDQVTPANAFARGGGRVQVDRAVRAGLVLHETKARFTAANPSKGGDLSALNLPSMARGKCVDQCVFTRTFRNTLGVSQAWRASVQGLSGSVSPAQFTMKPGERRTVTITINTSALPQDGSWNFGTLELQPGSSYLNPNLPALRLPVAVAYPAPMLKLAPESAQLSVAAGSNEKVTFTVANVGGALLGFTVDNTGTSIATVGEAKSVVEPIGYGSGSYTDQPGEYVGDDFTVPVPTRLTSLLVEGYPYAPLTSAATSLTWSIYPDNAGKPAGNPEATPGTAVWTYTAPPVQAGVDTTDGNISLDLVQAGQNVDLPPGKYWLVVHARTSFANRWLWRVATTGNGTFMTIKPSAGGWTSNSNWKGLAFRVRGEVGCGAPWFGAVTPTMGQVAHDTSTGVQVQLTTSVLAVGSYGGYLCLTTNDPARPKVAARIGVTVRP